MGEVAEVVRAQATATVQLENVAMETPASVPLLREAAVSAPLDLPAESCAGFKAVPVLTAAAIWAKRRGTAAMEPAAPRKHAIPARRIAENAKVVGAAAMEPVTTEKPLSPVRRIANHS